MVVFRRICFATPLFLQSGVADPACIPEPGRALAVRVMRHTETVLQALCVNVGLTFWGHAAGMILDYFAVHPAAADTDALTAMNAPAMLLRNGGSRRFTPLSTSRNVKLILTPIARDWLNTQIAITATQQSLSSYCALVLHRNAARGADLVRAARQRGL